MATEFAIVKIRGSRIDQLIAEGNTRAIAAKEVTSKSGRLSISLSAWNNRNLIRSWVAGTADGGKNIAPCF